MRNTSMPGDRDTAEHIDELDDQERYNLRQLEKRVRSSSSVTPEAVSEVLPKAVLLSNGKHKLLTQAMVETTEGSIELSITTDPERLSTVLFPIIGAVIRKALNRLVSDTLMRMNAGLENTLSFRRIAWHFESLRTGVPYINIVMRDTLLYRVEHVFLIHKKSGILLRSLSQPGLKVADEDMVASMLTAIRDYIKDSLALEKGEAVTSLSAGEFSIIVEEGPYAVIAVIVRGAADPELRDILQNAIESLHLRFSQELSGYSGDTDIFEATDPYLRPCLVGREKGDRKKIPVYALAFLLSVFAVLAFFVVRGGIDSARRGAFISALKREPGIVVVESRPAAGKTELHLLRDPYAKEIADVAKDYPVRLSDFVLDVEAYASLDPSFIEKRLNRLLAPPPTVSLAYRDRTLYVGGWASDDWRTTKLPLAYAVEGVDKVVLDAAPSPRSSSTVRAVPENLLSLAKELSTRSVNFEQDSSRLFSGQSRSIADLKTLISTIVTKSRAAGVEPVIEVVGHAAGTVQDTVSEQLSRDRAERIRDLLASGSPDLAASLTARGVGSSQPIVGEVTPDDKRKNRTVTFRVTFR